MRNAKPIFCLSTENMQLLKAKSYEQYYFVSHYCLERVAH